MHIGIYINIKKIKGVVFMNKRLKELIIKEFLTSEELDEIYLMNEVDRVEYNGYSGLYLNRYWYTIYLKNNEEYAVYLI